MAFEKHIFKLQPAYKKNENKILEKQKRINRGKCRKE